MKRYDWNWEDIKGVPLGELKGPARSLPPAYFFRQLWKQVLAAGLLFLAFTLVFRLEGAGAGRWQQALRYYLRDPAADQTSRIAEVVQDVLWLDAYDRWVYHGFRSGAEAVPAFRPEETAPHYPQMAVPVSGEIFRSYGWAEDGSGRYFHSGIDIKAKGRSPVKAVMDGRVTQAGEDPRLGKIIEIDHGDGWTTVYGTLGEIYVQPSQTVRQGDTIAVLASGTAVQLHFEVRRNGQPLDPMAYLAPMDKI